MRTLATGRAASHLRQRGSFRPSSTAAFTVTVTVCCVVFLALWARGPVRRSQPESEGSVRVFSSGRTGGAAGGGVDVSKHALRGSSGSSAGSISLAEVPAKPYDDEPSFLRLKQRVPTVVGGDPNTAFHLGPLLEGVTPPEPPQVPPYVSLFEHHNATAGTVLRDAAGGGYDGWMSWHRLREENPRIVYVGDFWTPQETAEIRRLAGPAISRSQVVAHSAKDAVNNVRTSFGMFLSSAEHRANPVVQAAMHRASRVSLLPVENVEAIQVLHYEAGQEYKSHPDYFMRNFREHLSRGGQRVATVFTWLNEPREGGETSFPTAGVTVKPKHCDAIVFYSCHKEEDETGLCKEDPFSHHAALPPKPGNEKWAAVFWIRQRAFR